MFEPVSDLILLGNKPLLKWELDEIAKSIRKSEEIIDLCLLGDRNDDVLDYHEYYLGKCVDRLERSLAIVVKLNKKSIFKIA